MKKVMLSVSMGVLLAGTLGLSSTGFAAEKSYGNGVYCNKHTCHVNWGEAWGSIIRNSAENIISFGNSGWH